MLHASEGMARAGHGVSRLEQRLVKGSAVVSNQHVEAGEIRGERVQQGGFLAVVPHEELADAETFPIDTADANQKCVSAGAPGQTGGLGIEKGPGGGRGVGDGAGGERREKVVRELDQIGNFVTAITLVAGVELLRLEVLAHGSFDHFTGEELFDESGGVVIRAAWRLRWGKPGVFAVNAGDGLTEMGQLFADVHRCAFIFVVCSPVLVPY
jgi:hypothetical protein